MQFVLNETEYAEYLTLKEQNSELSHKLEVARSVSEEDRSQIKELTSLVEQGKQSIKERDARIEDLVTENQTYCDRIAEMLRDCLGTSKVLEETQKISAKRLETMNHLHAEVRRLKAEHVCIVTNPRTGTVRVASVTKADNYRQFRWLVSEEYLVDRPA